MRLVSLAIFAAVALVVGAFEKDGMTLLIGVASALAAFASLPRFRTSIFLSILSDIFAVETVLFGLADIVVLLGYWPKRFRRLSAAQLSAACDRAVRASLIFVSRTFLRPEDDEDRRSVLRGADADHDPSLAALRRSSLRQSLYARINVFFLILINQFQVALGVRLQLLLPGFRQRHPGARRSALGRVLVSVAVGFPPLVTISILACLVEFYVASNFVLQWRRWMTASFTSRWLLQLDALQLAAAASAASTRQPRPAHLQDIGGFISGSGGRGTTSGNVGIYNYTIQAIVVRDQPGLVLDHPVGDLRCPDRADLRRRESLASCSGSPSSTPASRPA